MSPAPGTPAEDRPVVAAGAVVSTSRQRVLLVHRPKYDDWSFPKGKVDPGEHVTATAVREVAEETGLDVRLGVPLPQQHYTTGDGSLARPKVVHYWAARVVGSDDVSAYRPNAEIDQVAWVPYAEALDLLTYEHDRGLLEQWHGVRKPTRTLVVLRHAKAARRRDWTGDDRLRPLEDRGNLESEELVPVLAAYGVAAVTTSPNTRCTSTVAPFAAATGCAVDIDDALSEEGATTAGVAAAVERLLNHPAEHTLLCSHRPVLPRVLRVLEQPYERLEPAGMLVVHHRTTSHGVRRVVAVEHHTPRR
ncbi:MAG: NUDIX hydrolase [Nocardioides sp.]|nr:NUDIX hydrolase [Nocardioides sp.]